MATTVKTPVKKTVKAEPAKKPVAKKAVSGLNIAVLDLKGQEVEKVSANPKIFGVSVSPKLLATYVRVFLANQRTGTASAKTRGEVIGTTKKVYRQKGTGRARHGARKASLFRGGGVTFGPIPHDFSLKMNKKQKKQALFGALSLSLKEGRVLGLSDAATKMEAKTKAFAKFVKGAGKTGQKMLVVLPKLEKNSLVLASRNIAGIEVTDAASLNAYRVLNTKNILFVKSSIDELEKHFLKNEN